MTSLKTALSELAAAFPATDLESERAFGGRTWRELDPEFLEYHHDAMLFLTPEAFGSYLPAYLTAVANGGPAIRNLPTFLRGALTRTRDPQRFDARIRTPVEGATAGDRQRARRDRGFDLEPARSRGDGGGRR